MCLTINATHKVADREKKEQRPAVRSRRQASGWTTCWAILRKRVEQETQKLIAYINDEVVPAIREHSTTALRIASEKLNQAADMMEANTRRKKR